MYTIIIKGDAYSDTTASLYTWCGIMTPSKTPIDSAKAIYSKKDEYDFRVGALIAMMRLCGENQRKRAFKEFFKHSVDRSNGATEKELAFMKEENAKLKKEIEYLKARTTFADAIDGLSEVFKQLGKECAEEAKKATSKVPPRKKLTKREKFWHDVKQNIKEYGGQWICVFTNDYDYFIKELEKELPTVTWADGERPSEFDPWRSEPRRYVYLGDDEYIYWSEKPKMSVADKKVFTYRPEDGGDKNDRLH